MRISHSKKFVFIAYPRTGSNTVRHLVDPYSDIAGGAKAETSPDFPYYDHITMRELLPIFSSNGWNFSEYRSFCFVRSPFSRLPSLFRQRLGYPERDDAIMKPHAKVNQVLLKALPRKIGFAYYLLTHISQNQIAANLQAYIMDNTGKMLIRDVLLFENFESEIRSYLGRLDIPIEESQIPHLYANPKGLSYRADLSGLTIGLIKRHYAYEISRFGYRIPD